ncbi:MAG: aminotransferase class IV [Bdellovibrionota bacterium]
MYSSYWNAYIDDPRLMLIPMEDHLVHRGDGVFEAFKIINGKIYLMKEHFDRLERSAEALSLNWPLPRAEVEKVLKEMIEIKKVQTAGLRIFLSRGMGTFSANPYDSKQAHFHFLMINSKMPSAEKYALGASLGRSQIEPKGAPWSEIKSCNYLPNVLMKKEAVDRGLDFTLGFDEQGFITECSTENLIILDQKNQLCRPQLRRILKGTTMMRVFELAQKLVPTGKIKSTIERNISESDLFAAKELMIVGTTWDVLSVTKYEGKNIFDGKVGAISKELLSLLQEDQTGS